MPPQPSSKSALHLARELTKGTAEAAPTVSIPIRGAPKAGRTKTKLPDMSLRGSAVDSYSEADGVYHGTIGWEGDVFADSIGFLLKGILGEEALAGAGPYTHAFNVLNSGDQQPPSHTVWDAYGVNVRRYPGGQVSKLGFAWDDTGLLTYSVDFVTLGDAVVSAPTSAFGTLAPHPAWASTCLIGGVAAYPLSGSLDITRNDAGPVHVQDGNQGPRYMWVGSVALEGKCTLLMEDDVYYQQFIDNTQPTLNFNFATGAGATATGLQLLMSKATWREPAINRAGSYVKLDLGFKGLGNTTDAGVSGGYSPMKATLTNARSTVY